MGSEQMNHPGVFWRGAQATCRPAWPSCSLCGSVAIFLRSAATASVTPLRWKPPLPPCCKEAERFEEDLDSTEYHDATEEPTRKEETEGSNPQPRPGDIKEVLVAHH